MDVDSKSNHDIVIYLRCIGFSRRRKIRDDLKLLDLFSVF
jgi:hypothetical protein